MNLTNEEIKDLIRRSQGWTELKEGTHQYGWKRGDEWHYLHNVPSYPEDLNACAEFEASFADDDEFSEKYWLALYDVTQNTRWPYDATARQRCLAYLKTKRIIP